MPLTGEQQMSCPSRSVRLVLSSLLLVLGYSTASLHGQHPLHTLEKPKFSPGLAVFSPDSKHLAVVGDSREGDLLFWDLQTGKCVATLLPTGLKDRMGCIAFTPDGKHLLCCGDDKLHVWDLGTYKEDTAFAIRKGAYGRFALSPDGKLAAVALPSMTAVFYDVKTGKEVGELIGDGGVRTMEFSPDGKWLAVNYKNRVVIWDVATRKELKFLWNDERRTVQTLHFSPDGKSIFVDLLQSNLVVWDPHERKERPSIDLKKVVRTYFEHFAISPDGKLLALAYGPKAALWDLTKNEVRTDFEFGGHSDMEVRNVVFSPDSTLLATVGGDKKVRVWKIPPPPK